MLGRPAGARQEAGTSARAGEFLWQRDCASCHGVAGQGTRWAPDLTGQGAAGVSLAITSGRMPLPADAVGRDDPPARERQVPRGPVVYTPEEVDALVAHAGRILSGPEVPHVDLSTADRSAGASLFQLNCAACHTWSGRGGALTSGQVAVSLVDATPVEVVEAMRTGPGTMPVFDEATLDERQATDVTAYVEYLDRPRTPLGHPLWFIGPVAEGMVAWVVGLVALLLLVRWIGARTPAPGSGSEDHRG
nr:c-type cytochrome [Salsipaludibacter albus]